MRLSDMAKSVRTTLSKHSPEILVGIGISGMVATTILAVRATPKALILIEEAKREKESDSLTPVETIQAAWKCYIPAAVTGMASIACIIGSNSVNAKRSAALATAYTLSENALREYKDKVVETIGEKKEKEVRNAIAKDKIEKNPVSSNEVILTKKGDTLCYDVLSGRYFKSDIEKLKRCMNEINRQILNDGSASLNDFYYEIGLDSIKIGDDLGWDTRQGLVDIEFSSQLASDGTPCLVLDFSIAPVYDYYR